MAINIYRNIFVIGLLSLIIIGTAGSGCNPTEENPLLRHTWVSFWGGAEDDAILTVAVDSQGNLVVAGISAAPWGSPLNPHTGDGSSDVFVAKFTSRGHLVWVTFFGGNGDDSCATLLIDQNDNILMTGSSTATWGSPVVANSGRDAYVAKLAGSGQLLWNTFLGSPGEDLASDLAMDGQGNLLLAGVSDGHWGTPVLPHIGSRDGFVTKLNANGILQWNTFLGSVSEDFCTAVTVDNQNRIFVGGQSQNTWGNPLNSTSGSDGFVASLDLNGNLVWNTFFNSTGFEEIWDMVCDQDNNLVMTVNDKNYQAVEGGLATIYLAYVLKMDVTGQVIWKKQFGSIQDDRCRNLTIDGNNNIFVVGESSAEWGDPIHPHNGSMDAFALKLNRDGQLIWHTFMGSGEDDFGYGIAFNNQGEMFLGGLSMRSWGTPINPYSGKGDGFLTRILISQE